MACNFLSLPDELIQQIFLDLPLDSLASCIRTCKRLEALSGTPLLWKPQCLMQYQYWSSHHDLKTLLKAPSGEVDWKGLLAKRKNSDISISTQFNRCLPRYENRTQQLESIAVNGYDAKDWLIRQLDAPKTSEDHLARKYWASSLLGTIERSVGASEWRRLLDTESDASHSETLTPTPSHYDYPLERVFGALDRFLLEHPPETIEQISEHLDNIANGFRQEHSDIDEYPLRNKATAIAAFLRSHGFKGVPEGRSYRDLRNASIGLALCDKDHPSLPLILSIIYCSIARRLGLRAFVCNFPFQVVCRITTYDSRSLNEPGNVENPTYPEDEDATVMFLNPYDNAEEVASSFLLSQLQGIRGWTALPANAHECLLPCPPSSFLQRMMANIHQSNPTYHSSQGFTQYRIATVDRFLPKSVTMPVRFAIDRFAMRYLRHLFSLVFSSHNHDNFLSSHAEGISQIVGECFPTDGFVLKNQLLPTLQGSSQILLLYRSRIEQFWNEVLPPDKSFHPKERHRAASSHGMSSSRNASSGLEPGARNPKYHVGDYFRHRRYGYHGMIIGWDYSCEAGDAWIKQMQVDRLDGGRRQPFYQVVDHTRGSRYVAEENIETAPDELKVVEGGEDTGSGASEDEDVANDGLYLQRWQKPTVALMHVAGRYFKRWDAKHWRFVSNIEDLYPDG
ncbi:MAG: hypothetical protein M1831_006795 [Alyxoria varia]|nr:MAG: hypothetical protein M1831_006795 [Alyxoria varia]